jgi:2-hydroxy-3-oxopropionate reductase
MVGKVGFIGLGIMGKPMAHNLMEAGYGLVVYNRSWAAVEELAVKGAETAGSPKEVVEACDTVITMLPDSPQVEEVVTGENGVLEGVTEGTLLVDMSTISPVATEKLAQKTREMGASMLDAPVSGGETGAEAGTLSIMVGGSQEDFERAKPLFDVMGKTIVHVGESGTGQVVKACNQIVVALTIEAVSEALVLGSKAGASPAKVIQVLSGGLAGKRKLPET